MLSKNPKVCVIILNWNGSKDTVDCLRSLEKMKTDGINPYVVIVDNCSKNEDLKVIKDFKTKIFDIRIIENGENLGFAGGNNKGIEYALKSGADFILFLNNDTEVDEKFLVELFNASKKFKDAGIFSPKIYFKKGYEFKKIYKKDDLGHVIWSFGGVIDWNNVYATNKNVDAVDNGKYSKDFETDFATGAAMFVRSEVLKKYKGFDERYYLYFEDVDLCEKYKKDGGKIYTVSKAIVWHKVSQSSAIGSSLNDYFITRNRLLFGMKYASARTKMALYRESVRLLLNGRIWQKRGVLDYYTKNLYKGSWK